MTENELLADAAFAVNRGAWHPLTHDTPNGIWNPLADDGDAFRLAVELRMDVSMNVHHCIACADTGHIENNVENGDVCAAARRAIVRAAAAMAPEKTK